MDPDDDLRQPDALERDMRHLCSPTRARAEPGVASVVLPSEDPVAFVIARVRLEEEHRPTSDEQRLAIFEIMAARWRRRRIDDAELAVIDAAGGLAALSGSREGRAQHALFRVARNAEWRIEHAAGAALRRAQKEDGAVYQRHERPHQEAMRELREEHALDLRLQEAATREAVLRAEAAEAALVAARAPAEADPQPETTALDPALYPTEANMAPLVARLDAERAVRRRVAAGSG